MLFAVPMSKTGSLVRLSRLDKDRRRLLVHATMLLSLASAAVALLPFRFAIRLGLVSIRTTRPIDPEVVVWAVEAAARRLPWRTVCIEKSIVVQRMLRGAGIDAVLHYGARHAATSELEAHVWVTVDGQPVIGGEEASNFAPVARYP
jgi:hypothetical protein